MRGDFCGIVEFEDGNQEFHQVMESTWSIGWKGILEVENWTREMGRFRDGRERERVELLLCEFAKENSREGGGEILTEKLSLAGSRQGSQNGQRGGERREGDGRRSFGRLSDRGGEKEGDRAVIGRIAGEWRGISDVGRDGEEVVFGRGDGETSYLEAGKGRKCRVRQGRERERRWELRKMGEGRKLEKIAG